MQKAQFGDINFIYSHFFAGAHDMTFHCYL